MVTEEQRRRFGRVQAGYEAIEKKPKVKPTHGKILIDGIVYRENLPFPLLQHLKTELIRDGYPKKRISIKYC